MKVLKIFISLSFALGVAPAQTPRAEIGLQLSGIRETALGEYPAGVGGRVTIHTFRFVDSEAEVNRYPIGGSVALFPATEVLFGARIGRRFGPIGLYGKVRPGFMRFDSNARVPNLGTRAVLDWGAVLEFYSRHHFAARSDFGDTVVWYGRDTVIPPISVAVLGIVPGTRHQLQWSLGVSIWF